MIREKMDFEHDELVPYTPIAGAVYRWKMSEHGLLRLISLRNDHSPYSLFITLPVGGIHKTEISKMVACLSNPKIHTGRSLGLIVSFYCKGVSILIITQKKTFKYYCVGMCIGNTDYCLFVCSYFMCSDTGYERILLFDCRIACVTSAKSRCCNEIQCYI